MERQAVEDLNLRLENFTTSKAVELSGPVWNFENNVVEKLVHSYMHNDDLLRAELYDADGEMIAHVENEKTGPYDTSIESVKPLVHKAGDDLYTIGKLRVVYHDGRVESMLRQRRLENVVSILAVILVLGLTIWLSLHLIVAVPLMRLKESLAGNIGKNKYDPIPLKRNDELGAVVTAFNDLLAEVENQKKRLKAVNKTLLREMEQRAQAEKDLQLTAKVFEVSIEGIAIINAAGEIVSVNASFEKVTGYAADEVIGKKLRDVKSSLADDQLHDTIAAALETKGHWSGDVWNTRKNGESYADTLSIFKVTDDNSGDDHLVAVFHDITKKKLAERDLLRSRDEFERQVSLRTMELRQANEKLMEMDRLRNAFLSSASHELRTPLTSVRGFVKIVRKDFCKEFLELSQEDIRNGEEAALVALVDNPKARRILENLSIIEQEGDRLTRLIDDLLDLNKIESGRMEWRDERLDLGETVQNAIKVMGVSDASDCSLELHIEDDLPNVMIDRDRFQQVIINLVGNAMKFAPQGSIDIRVERGEQGVLRISVKDDGIGIKKENLENVFQRFFQVEQQDKDKPKGTGLGLAICKNIVEHYGGRIGVTSAEGEGSTFTVELPHV